MSSLLIHLFFFLDQNNFTINNYYHYYYLKCSLQLTCKAHTTCPAAPFHTLLYISYHYLKKKRTVITLRCCKSVVVASYQLHSLNLHCRSLQLKKKKEKICSGVCKRPSQLNAKHAYCLSKLGYKNLLALIFMQ